jgi:hypothetical protein
VVGPASGATRRPPGVRPAAWHREGAEESQGGPEERGGEGRPEVEADSVEDQTGSGAQDGQGSPGASEESHGGPPLVEPPGPLTEAEVRDLITRLARTLPGPHYLSGSWVLSRCPACGGWSISWNFHLCRVLTTCGCLNEPGLVRVDRLPVEPVTAR